MDILYESYVIILILAIALLTIFITYDVYSWIKILCKDHCSNPVKSSIVLHV